MSVAEKLTLRPGQRLTRDEFIRRWELLPDLKFADRWSRVYAFALDQRSRDESV
jgi:hypothetical protein